MKRFPWRALLYVGILIYLLVDLRWWKGPLHQKIASLHTPTRIELAAKNSWVAAVNQEPITRRQLDVALYRHLHQRGKDPGEIPDATLLIMRRAIMQTLINDALVRHYSEGEKFRAPQIEIDAFIDSWESQFSSTDELEERSKLQNLSKEQRDAELARIWSQKRWLEKRIEPAVAISDEEIRQWFDANDKKGSGFTEPEKILVRQIFISTIELDDETRKKIITDAYEKLTDGEKPAEFAKLASEISEDGRSKLRGGDLNWFSRERMPKDFCDKVFPLKKGEVSKPFRTKIGWHIVEVLDRQATRPAKSEDVADEIRAHLRSEAREETIQLLMKRLRKAANIELFPENI